MNVTEPRTTGCDDLLQEPLQRFAGRQVLTGRVGDGGEKCQLRENDSVRLRGARLADTEYLRIEFPDALPDAAVLFDVGTERRNLGPGMITTSPEDIEYGVTG